MVHEEICTYEVCKLAKEKGFPQLFNYANFKSKLNYYNHKGEINGDVGDILKLRIKHNPVPEEMKPIAAPTQSLLQRWLREERGLILIIRFDPSKQMYDWGVFLKTQLIEFTASEKYFEKYELALEDALKYALENLV